MPADSFTRINLDLIYPPFLEKILDVIAACRDRGAIYVATHGFRTYGEQMELWSQGRTKPGKIVTNAKGGQSAHNFGLAIDFVRDMSPNPGVQPGWLKGDYGVLAEEAEKAGLHSGKAYKDWPHVAWPGYVSAKDLAELDKAFKATAGDSLTKLKAAWGRLPSTGP